MWRIRMLRHWVYKMVQPLGGIWYFLMSLMVSPSYDLTNLLLCIYPRGTRFMYTRLYMYYNVHSSIVHSCPKLDTTKYPPTVKWIHELWYIQAMEYYMTTKMNELKPHATAQINLTWDSEKKNEKKKTRTLKNTHCMIPFI